MPYEYKYLGHPIDIRGLSIWPTETSVNSLSGRGVQDSVSYDDFVWNLDLPLVPDIEGIRNLAGEIEAHKALMGFRTAFEQEVPQKPRTLVGTADTGLFVSEEVASGEDELPVTRSLSFLRVGRFINVAGDKALYSIKEIKSSSIRVKPNLRKTAPANAIIATDDGDVNVRAVYRITESFNRIVFGAGYSYAPTIMLKEQPDV